MPARVHQTSTCRVLPLFLAALAANRVVAALPQLATPAKCKGGPESFCGGPWAAQCGFPPAQKVALCGYSKWPDCQEMSLQGLCTVALGKGVEGGVSGAPTARFDRVVLALYWVPTYCSKHDQGSAFCSPFAGPASPSAKRLALHGLWPDWGAPNGATATAWPQYCDGFFECQQGYNTTKKEECSLPSATVGALNTSAAWQAYAPAWAAPRGEAGANLGDHEWAKHGACVGVDADVFARQVLSTGTPEIEGRGAVFQLGAATTGTVKLSQIKAVYGDTAVLTCEEKCQFGQISLCYGSDSAGKPTIPIKCPTVSLQGDTCSACEVLTLPSF